jgi:hypothetical protein
MITQDNSVLALATRFRDRGDWTVEQQFVLQMGSSYLLAHGIGTPLPKDAETAVEIPGDGEYTLYVRTKNWTKYWSDAPTPGVFQVLLDGAADGETFGTGKRAANFDADQDGMADAWEQLNGGDLQPNTYTLDSQYTNLEVYLSSLVEDIMKAGNEGAESPLNDHYPTCQKLPDDPNIEPEDPELPDGQQGNVTWELSSTTTATYSTSFDSYVTAPELTMGSNLSISGNGTYGDVRFTKFTAETAESAAAESNKVLLKVNSKGGYKFRATNIAFQACKIGTDNGNFDVKWTDGGGTKVLATAVAPNRNNAAGGYFSNHSYDVTALSTETNGECTLQLNLYNIGFIKEGVMTKKEMGLANIIINGVITNTDTGISTPVTLTTDDTPMYNLQGQQVDSSYKGIVIKNGKKYLQK